MSVLNIFFDIEANTEIPTHFVEPDKQEISLGGLVSIGLRCDDGTKFCVNFVQETPPEQWSNYKDFWSKFPQALVSNTENQVSFEKGFQMLANFLQEKRSKYKKIKWWAGPSAYDWMWLKVFWERYAPKDQPNIGFKANCVSSYLQSLADLLQISKDGLENTLAPLTEIPHPHTPVEDSTREMYIFRKTQEMQRKLLEILRENPKFLNNLCLCGEVQFYIFMLVDIKLRTL